MFVAFIYGPAASGKHTIGSILSEQTGIPLFHNHLTVDLAKTLFEFGTLAFIRLREEIWLTSFTIASEAQQSFIFTFNPETTVDPNLISKLQQIVEGVGGKVHYIELLCSDREVLTRLGNESRAKFGKLLDGELYQQVKSQGGFDFPPLPTALITIDTEKMKPEESAQAIQHALLDVA